MRACVRRCVRACVRACVCVCVCVCARARGSMYIKRLLMQSWIKLLQFWLLPGLDAFMLSYVSYAFSESTVFDEKTQFSLFVSFYYIRE